MKLLWFFLLLLPLAANANNKDWKLSKAGGKDDQSFQIGVGWHENGGSGEAYAAEYRHPLFQWVKTYLTLDRVRTDAGLDRSEFLVGLQPYPFKNGFYFSMGAGVSKSTNKEEAVFSGGFGYELDVFPVWYLDFSAGADWSFDGTARWAGIIGIGKRF